MKSESIEPPKSITEMATEQGIGQFDFAEARRVAADIWPDDKSLDDFTAWLRESRKEGVPERRLTDAGRD